jgi:hypothetical protein
MKFVILGCLLLVTIPASSFAQTQTPEKQDPQTEEEANPKPRRIYWDQAWHHSQAVDVQVPVGFRRR